MTAKDSSQPLQERGSNRSHRPQSKAFREFIARDWQQKQSPPLDLDTAAHYTPARRHAISQQFPGERLVIPAGGLKVRSNDTDYRFRPHSAFAHLTGLGTDEQPDAVLVLHPEFDDHGNPTGHTPVLYFHPLAPRDSDEFWANPRYGEFWVGPRPTLDELESRTGISTAHIDELPDAISKDSGHITIRVVPQADETISALVAKIRQQTSQATSQEEDAKLAEALSELRLVKDEWEIDQMRQAIEATITGFERIVEQLPRATTHPRGERVVEAAFATVAREEGNGLGYETIAAAGNNATILHWIRNNGSVAEGELILVDAGVEIDSLYTADLTRTLPVNGRFTPVQRRVYDAVLEAADAAFSRAKPGVKFRDVHEAAMEVLAHRLSEWGLLPVSAPEAIDVTGQHHRRWMPHGTSHHLGIDVHDCAQARREMYLDAELRPGMIFTIEPGLYFKEDDLAVPKEYRGIGVRIEDDVLVTSTGVENLSAALPRAAEDVESWMSRLLNR